MFWKQAARILSVLLTVVFIGFLIQDHALAQSNDGPNRIADKPAQDEPFLVLNSGGHTAPITALAYSRDGRFLISSGNDKTVSVWDAASGRLQRVIRGQISPGEEGKIYALAVSPDSKLLAAGGYLGPPSTCADDGASQACGDIRIIDIETGQMLRKLSAHIDVVNALGFSRSGALLASWGPDGRINIWDVAEGKLKATVHQADIYGNRIVFLPDETQVAVAGADGVVSIYEWQSGKLVKSLPIPNVDNLYGLAVSEDGKMLAAAGDGGTVRIWSLPEGEVLWDIKDVDPQLRALAFGSGTSADLLAMSSLGNSIGVDVWNVISRSKVSSYKGFDDLILGLAFSPDGSHLAAAGGKRQQIHIWGPAHADKTQAILGGTGSQLYGTAFLRPPGGSGNRALYIAWGAVDPCPDKESCPDDERKLDFAMRLPDTQNRTTGEPEPLAADYSIGIGGNAAKLERLPIAHRAEAGELTRQLDKTALEERYSTLVLKKEDANPLEFAKRGLDRGQDHISYSFDTKGQWIVDGGRNGILDIVSTRGEALHDLVGHEGDVNSVAVSPDDRFIVTASSDQTVRLWNGKTGELIVSLFHDQNSEWILWTPQGYYDASPGGEKLIGWHINKGRDRAADFLDASDVRAHFYRKDVVTRAIVLGSAEAAVEEFRKAGNLSPLRPADLRFRAPPDLVPVFSALRSGSGPFVFLELPQPQASEAITEFFVTVNGRPVVDTRMQDIENERTRDVDLTREGKLRFKIPVFHGINGIVFEVMNNAGIKRDLTIVQYENTGEGELDYQQNAYVVAIGVDSYPSLAESSKLNYASADAIEFEKKIRERLKSTHRGTISTRLLYTGAKDENGDLDKEKQPTRENIISALDLFASATPQDTVILFIAGHASFTDLWGYFFYPSDGNPSQRASLVRWSDIQEAVGKQRQGRKFMFIDTCRSNDVFRSGVINDAVASGVFSFSSTIGPASIEEGPPVGHGYFTDALLKALDTADDPAQQGNGDKIIQISELANFVREQTLRESKQSQRPVYHPALGADDYVAFVKAP